jgi:nitrogen fixation-related uncharacterized protein
MMPLGLWVLVGWMAFVTASGVGLLLWAWRSGQFRHIEEAKYRMLEDRDPEPWPTKPGKKGRKKEGES